jgi:hypothetical protein
MLCCVWTWVLPAAWCFPVLYSPALQPTDLSIPSIMVCQVVFGPPYTIAVQKKWARTVVQAKSSSGAWKARSDRTVTSFVQLPSESNIHHASTFLGLSYHPITVVFRPTVHQSGTVTRLCKRDSVRSKAAPIKTMWHKCAPKRWSMIDEIRSPFTASLLSHPFFFHYALLLLRSNCASVNVSVEIDLT